MLAAQRKNSHAQLEYFFSVSAHAYSIDVMKVGLVAADDTFLTL